jgi:hypothetical protein
VIKDNSEILAPEANSRNEYSKQQLENIEKMSSHTFGLLNPILEPATSSDPENKNGLTRPSNPSYPSGPDAFQRSQTVEFTAPLNPVYPSDQEVIKTRLRPSMPLPGSGNRINQSTKSLGKVLKNILDKDQLEKLRDAYARSSVSSGSPSRSNSQGAQSGKSSKKIKLRKLSIKSQGPQPETNEKPCKIEPHPINSFRDPHQPKLENSPLVKPMNP